ncbi:MAG TPA: TlpA disulfide reductase family protein [Longimicrobium sp.]|nr:TlpA disulfide reductase family protein [Longimicrobium sp.]
MRIHRLLSPLFIPLALAACDTGSGKPGGGGGIVRAPQVGEPAPAYAAKTVAGQEVTLASMRGKPVLLNVWATWCHPCREELPDLERLHQAHAARGLRIVGVSIDAAGQEKEVADFAREYGVTYDLWLDPDDRVSSVFASVGVPTTVLIGPDGTLLWRHLGPVKADDPELLKALEQALAKPS